MDGQFPISAYYCGEDKPPCRFPDEICVSPESQDYDDDVPIDQYSCAPGQFLTSPDDIDHRQLPTLMGC